jgi:hypothetical protein
MTRQQRATGQRQGPRVLIAVCAAALQLGLIGLLAPPARADDPPEGGGGATAGPGGIEVWVKGAGAGGPPGAGGALGASRYQTVITPASAAININDPNQVCTIAGPTFNAPPARQVQGAYDAFALTYDTWTGQLVAAEATCAQAATPPTPPTPAEVFWGIRNNGFPRPVIRTNPDAVGITGLETRYWYPGADTISVSIVIRGYTVTAAMRGTSYQWFFGDGSEDTTSRKGGPASPATRHTYQSKDRYGLLLDMSWDGGYTYAGWGTSGSGGLPTIVVEAGRSYPVAEIRSVQTG